MSASFPLCASRSDDIFIRSIVISSSWIEAAGIKQSDASYRRKRDDLIMIRQKHELAAVASILATTSTANVNKLGEEEYSIF
jgi:hypothetical protein